MRRWKAAGTGLMLAFMLAACSLLGRKDADEGYVAPPPIATPPDMPSFAFPPLTPDALRGHIERLASDEFEGRAPSTRGEELTVDYISRAFAQAGLEPGVRAGGRNPSWFQDVPMAASTVTNSPDLRITGADGEESFPFGERYIAWSKRIAPRVALQNAELVFVGYGVVAPELGWNSYANVDMRGKVAVILINDPDFEGGQDRGFRGRAMTYYGRWTYKFEEAARQGAVGALIIHDSVAAAYPWDVVRSSWSGPQHDLVREDAGASRVGVEGWIDAETAQALFTRAGLDFAALRAQAQDRDFAPTPMNLRASVALDLHIETSVSRNVVGLLRGRAQGDETVIYSAHWDHLGRCPPIDGDDICNGARDNASGVAGLIELARRFANSGRLQRSVAFMAFTGEESGLLGSAYYAEHPLYPPSRTVAAINMDGLNTHGPTSDVTVVGYGQNELELNLDRAALLHGRMVAPDPFPERGLYYRSDHFNFARIGVPALYVNPGVNMYVGGADRGRALSNRYVAERYHKPGDEITDDWDLTGAMRDLLLLYEVGRDLGESRAWPNWRSGSEFRATREATRGDR